MQSYLSIIKRPVVTERATNLKAWNNQYVFRVSPDAPKAQVKQPNEQLFQEKVTSVNAMNVSGKFRRMGAAPGSYRPSWKKAIVRLAQGQEIKVEEAQ